MRRQLSSREKGFVALAVLVAAAAAALQFAPGPGERAAESQLSPQAAAARLRRLRTETDRLEKRLENATLPVNQTMPHLMRAAQGAAKQLGAAIQEIRPARPEPLPSGLVRQSLQVNLRASFPILVRLVEKIERSDPAIVADRLQTSAADENSDLVNGTLTLTVHSL